MTLRPTIRLRLTAWYAAIFLTGGTLLLGLGYLVVHEQFEPQVKRVEGPPRASGSIARAEQPADVERRVRAEERRRDEEALRDVLGWFAAILGLVTVGSVGIGWLVAGRALAPVSRITQTARQVSGHSLHERIALDGPRDELKELADTFDAMLARLDTTFESHRRFVANASHELRTPLAIIRAELEELADTGALGVEQQEMLANARRAATRSERLIASLLTLARSEGALQQRTPVDLASVVRQALTAERCAPAQGVQITTDLGPADVAGDPILLESLVVNLIENGLRHNHPDGELHIRTGCADQVELVVSNTGPVVDGEEVDRLVDPFVQHNRAATRSDGGFGLGLAIVRAVTAAHDGSVIVKARETGGLTVVVRLPAVASTLRQPRA